MAIDKKLLFDREVVDKATDQVHDLHTSMSGMGKYLMRGTDDAKVQDFGKTSRSNEVGKKVVSLVQDLADGAGTASKHLKKMQNALHETSKATSIAEENNAWNFNKLNKDES